MTFPTFPFLFLGILASMQGFGEIPKASKQANFRSIYAHLLVGDPESAVLDAAEALQSDPGNPALHEIYIKALAKTSDEKKMCIAFSNYCRLSACNLKERRELCEEMAWGVIAAGERSTSPIVRLYALIAAFFGDDARSVQQLQRACSDSNSAVRCAAVQLISHLHDTPLCDEILRLFREENVWRVRLEVIKAIGKMKIRQGAQGLVNLVAHPGSSVEERASAIESLVDLVDDIDRPHIVQLASSDLAGLRLLACKLIIHLESQRDADLLWKLSSDGHSEVRAAALRAIGLLGIHEHLGLLVADLAREKCRDRCTDVAITAAWLLSIQEPINAQSAFFSWLNHKIPEVRSQAAAALSATGSFGIECIPEFFSNSSDSGVKINLALGLIQQNLHLEMACDFLYKEFTNSSKRWAWNDEGSFRVLTSNPSCQNADMISSSEETYQLTRLEILNLLAILKYTHAQEAIQAFLLQRQWNISGLATAILLTEGDQDVIELIENILDVAPQNIKIQAALVIALWGRGERAINVLEQSYQGAEREIKEKILEGIGRIGALSSLPFLLERLQDPQQTLRLIAASAILQCLNH